MIAIVALAGLVACQAPQQPNEVLPAATGPHKTGRMSFHWKDTSRAELETSAPDDKRELMVHVFYPAEAGASQPRAPYVPDAEGMRGPWNEEQMARITTMRAFSRENAPLARGNARYPVIIFSPGGGMKGLTYHTLFEDLASHGWVVAAIDPPYNARAVRLSDGRVLGNLPPPERGWPAPRNGAEEVRFYQERVAHWSRDVSFVIDQLTALDRGPGPFTHRLDLQRGVGVAGHSRGGQAAGTVRLIDPRVRGAINLDGTAGEFGGFLPVDGNSGSGAQPFLWIQKSLPAPPTPEQLQRAGRTRAQYDSVIARMLGAWERRLGAVSGGAMRIYIDRPGVEHIDFSDEPFWDGRTTADARPGKLRTIADTRVWMRAFFDGTVRGDWNSLKRLAADSALTRSGVTVTVYQKPWPQ